MDPENGTKERILRVAAELYATQGYHGTGMAELSEAVQIGRGALYWHIGNKEQLLFEISISQLGNMIDGAQQVMDSDETPADKFRVMAALLLQNIASHQAEWTVFFREFYALTGDRREKILAERRRYEALWLRLFDEGVSRGDFKAVDFVLVKGILGMFNYSYLWIDPNGSMNPDEIASVFSESILSGISMSGGRRHSRAAPRSGTTRSRTRK